MGCGPGFLAAEMADEVGATGRVFGIDVSAYMIALARERCANLAQVKVSEGDAVAFDRVMVADSGREGSDALSVAR